MVKFDYAAKIAKPIRKIWKAQKLINLLWLLGAGFIILKRTLDFLLIVYKNEIFSIRSNIKSIKSRTSTLI